MYFGNVQARRGFVVPFPFEATDEARGCRITVLFGLATAPDELERSALGASGKISAPRPNAFGIRTVSAAILSIV